MVLEKASEILSEFRKISPYDPIIFLDYDGTLVPIIKNPEESYPDPQIMGILETLRKKYDTYVVTGRSLREIREFIGNNFNVIALHGAIKSLEDGTTDFAKGYQKYKVICDSIYSRRGEFLKRYPGVQIINKDGGLVFTKWFVPEQLLEGLTAEVKGLSVETGMEFYPGKMIVELRIPGIDKGKAIQDIRKGRAAIIVGDDLTDEDAYMENPDAFSIHIGDGKTAAHHSLGNYLELRDFLAGL